MKDYCLDDYLHCNLQEWFETNAEMNLLYQESLELNVFINLIKLMNLK